jgi:hypothetical protein
MDNLILETIQQDVLGTLQATPSLRDAKIIADDAGDIEARVIRSLAPMSGGESLLSGLAIVVLQPEITDAEQNLPGPPGNISIEIQVIENVPVNRSPNGTGLRSSSAALEVLASLQLIQLGTVLLYADRDPVQPLPVKTGHVSHAVRLLARSPGLTSVRCAQVVPSIAEDAITLTTATPEAVIRYTTDGSYPAAPHSPIYTDPFDAPPAGTVIRAAATAAGHTPSDLLEFTLTESE